MLQILNGDSTAGLLREAEMPGEIQPWREALVAGPTPRELSPEEWIARRAQFLSQADPEHDLEYCTNALRDQEQVLESYPQHDEVVLWFEHDLFCQVNLLYLLNWFRGKKLGKTTLSLICIDSFPGMIGFRGLGQLSPQQLASLMERRHEIESEVLRLAHRAWSAYCAPTPEELCEFVNQDSSPMPFLKNALLVHFERFPSLRNGLGKIENMALEIIAGGVNEFEPLFCIFSELEPTFGLGDLQFFDSLKKMISARKPLIEVSRQGKLNKPFNLVTFMDSSFELTPAGEAVLRAHQDFIEINGIDEWLGGVRLQGQHNLWRWNEEAEKLVHCE